MAIKFGTDGWRAVIAQDYTFDNVKILSQGVADYLKQKKGRRVVIGYDRRFLSKEFAQTAATVLAANGLKVVLSDSDVPTPAVSFVCRYSGYDLGVMITASHNPAKFNGYKLKTKEGGSADQSVTNAVEKLLYKSKVKELDLNQAVKAGKIKIVDLTKGYLDFFKKYVDLTAIRKLKLKVLVDTMWGTGSNYVERVLGRCGVKVDYLHNGFNPGFEGISPEPVETNLKELMARVKRGGYDMGVCLDGDADRIAMVDSSGNYVNAQAILPLLALHMIKNRKSPGGIAKTVVGTNSIDALALELGVACYETPVGFKYISSLFQQDLIAIGGEEAGGIGYRGYIPERDGSMSFLLVLEMMAREKKTFDRLLAELYKKYGRWYYSRTSVPVKSLKKGIEALKLPAALLGKKVERVNQLDGIKLITASSWLMFRASGTEPIVRVYAESLRQTESNRLMQLGKKMIYDL